MAKAVAVYQSGPPPRRGAGNRRLQPAGHRPSGPSRPRRVPRAASTTFALTLMVEQPPYPGEEDPHPQPGPWPPPQRLPPASPHHHSRLRLSGSGPAPVLPAGAWPDHLTLGHRRPSVRPPVRPRLLSRLSRGRSRLSGEEKRRDGRTRRPP